MAEAESLLNVSAGTSQDRMRNAPAARAMLKKLHSETSIFSNKEPPPERYLFILVRSDQNHYKTLHLTWSLRLEKHILLMASAEMGQAGRRASPLVVGGLRLDVAHCDFSAKVSLARKCLTFHPHPTKTSSVTTFLQDRLIYLDIADDFMAKAKRFYPPKDDSDEEIPGLAINLPLLLARVEAMNGRDKEEEEDDSEREDVNLSD